MEGYSYISYREEAKSNQFALMKADEVTLSVIDSDGWDVRFDRTPTKVIAHFSFNTKCS